MPGPFHAIRLHGTSKRICQNCLVDIQVCRRILVDHRRHLDTGCVVPAFHGQYDIVMHIILLDHDIVQCGSGRFPVYQPGDGLIALIRHEGQLRFPFDGQLGHRNPVIHNVSALNRDDHPRIPDIAPSRRQRDIVVHRGAEIESLPGRVHPSEEVVSLAYSIASLRIYDGESAGDGQDVAGLTVDASSVRIEDDVDVVPGLAIPEGERQDDGFRTVLRDDDVGCILRNIGSAPDVYFHIVQRVSAGKGHRNTRTRFRGACTQDVDAGDDGRSIHHPRSGRISEVDGPYGCQGIPILGSR